MDKDLAYEKNFNLTAKLKIDCAKCSGLCCVALYFMKTDGFPEDKASGKPCKNLLPNFRCAIYPQLAAAKMKGCMAYDCFGAGQMVTQLCHHNKNLTTNLTRAGELFLIIFQLHQMLWYLIEALSAVSDEHLIQDIEALIFANEQMTSQAPSKIITLDVEKYRLKVNEILKKVVTSISTCPTVGGKSKDFLGKDFKRANLDGRDFSMSLMIAANLEGCSLRGANFLCADMRDVNIKNADLSECVFLTQMQINSANGDLSTRLPANISRPACW